MKLKNKLAMILGAIVTIAMVSAGWIALHWEKSRLINGPLDFYLIVFVVLWLILLSTVYLISIWLGQRIEKLLVQAEEMAYIPGMKDVSFTREDELSALGRLMEKVEINLLKGEEIRNRLVSDVAHELRTPLAVLHGQLESMIDGAREMKPEQLVPLLDETVRMSRLIHDLQQLSLAETGKLQLERKWVSFSYLLNEVISLLQFEAEEKGIFINHLGMDPGEVYCDPGRVKQVLINLIGNAIRYTPDGGNINVSLFQDHHSVRVDIKDNGPGIAPEHLPYIFHRFYRVEGSRNRQSGGMGLGLALAKEFVNLHVGTLTASSELGKGTIFSMTLPRFPES